MHDRAAPVEFWGFCEEESSSHSLLMTQLSVQLNQ